MSMKPIFLPLETARVSAPWVYAAPQSLNQGIEACMIENEQELWVTVRHVPRSEKDKGPKNI